MYGYTATLPSYLHVHVYVACNGIQLVSIQVAKSNEKTQQLVLACMYLLT